MKFKCGPSAEKRRKKVEAMVNWHDHFAWWPVKFAYGEYGWLETVQRRYEVWHHAMGGFSPQFREKPR